MSRKWFPASVSSGPKAEDHITVDSPEREDAAWQRCITARRSNGRIALDSIVIDPEWKYRDGDMGDTHWG
ncbi:MAG: hypothetical protein QGI25_13885 [Arenicellales bacterium]|jgi:hypothetical protein|nr:hypothetical protein [Arenicellales bacterium]HJN49617.1 hypothetical protein [Pseudomonadales bacterium]|tara:strand:+ start:557 stop:766 length:210 start_codon:yes stop_codon:yes gene_type:complete